MVSDSEVTAADLQEAVVLILVVMEYGLRLLLINIFQTFKNIVLILVVMEYGLRHVIKDFKDDDGNSLNPCCNGIWSQTVCHVVVFPRL